MLRRFLKKQLKPYINSTKILNKIAFLILILFCCCFVFSLNNASTSAYTLAEKGSMIVPGVVGGGNCTIYPVTHPLFIVQLYKTEGGMKTDTNGFNNQANTIKTVIPHASEEALWLCSNVLSEYLINQNFNTAEQVYLARKSSISAMSMDLSGGENNKKSTGRIKYLSEYKTTEPNKDFNNGIFYNTLLQYYIADNRSFKALANDSKFAVLLNKPSDAGVMNSLKCSMELWSYITEVNAKGSSAAGWSYTIDTKPKIDGFLQINVPSDKQHKGGELYEAGLKMNDWSTSSLNQITTNKQTITVGEAFNLRYLDLLITLYTIANNKEYWKKGIISYLTDNNGASNICITSGIVERTTSIGTQGGNVEPATVLAPCNDVTQVAYRIGANYNLSDRKSSETVYEKAKSTEYLERLKKAVSLSQSSTYYHTAIYDPAIISRIIPERVRKVKNNKLIWGDSYNTTSVSKFLWFKIEKEKWYGANWVLEPPISTAAVNYRAVLKIDSVNSNKLNNKTGPFYQKGMVKIILYKLKDLFSTEISNNQKTVKTKDEVHVQVALEALAVKDGTPGKPALQEWENFIKKNTISDFQIKIILSRAILPQKYDGTSFTTIPLDSREFPQTHAGTNEWCTSSKWIPITAQNLLILLQGKNSIGEWKDNSIPTLDVTEGVAKDIALCSRVYIQYKAKNGKWYYLTGKEGNTTEKLSISNKNTTIADIKESNKTTIEYNWKANTSPPGDTVDYPSDTWTSEEPSLAYAELKEGSFSNETSIFNETFEAMAGVPTTRTLYFSSGGNEFMADLQVNYEANSSAVRKYTSHFNGNECEFKTGDQAKSYTVPSPPGNPSSDVTVNVHEGDVTVSATWTGDIPNKATAKTVTALHEATATCPAIPDRTAYNAAKSQASSWASTLQGYSISHTAASDGKTRKVFFSNASITSDSAVDPVTTTASDSKPCSYKDPSYDSKGNITSPGVPCGNEMATAKAEPGPTGSYTITVTATIPAHVICGPCCQHDLPAISDTWTQYISYDTIDITKCKVYKIQKGYVTGMDEITYNSDENVIASITQGDPNIFYNIAAYNNPAFSNGTLTNASRIGRIRYTLQEAQGDDVYYEEMASGVTKRTNKCDGMASTVCASNPVPAGGKGHNETYATGCLYTNTAFKNEERKNIATTGVKNAYSSETDTKDLATAEWQRFWQRRNQSVTATVISDMLILQTSSGDQSPVYFTENSTAKAQENFPTLRAVANGSTSIKSNSNEDKALKDTQDSVDAKWAKMWTNNTSSFAKVVPNGINVGSYNGKYNTPAAKYQGTGNAAVISTRFDNDTTVFSSAKDELGLAQVSSKQSFPKSAYGAANIASSGKSQARMDRVTNLRMYADKIKQKPTNKNAEYITGDSYVFYLPILKYSLANDSKTGLGGSTYQNNEVGENEQIADDGTADGEVYSDTFEEKESDILKAAGYNYGPGLIYKSKYSAYNDNSDYKVNNIVTLDAVSVQNAMIVKSGVEDKRTTDGIVKDAMKTLSALEKCPGTPELCEYRVLNCKYTLDTASLSFDFEDKINTDTGSEDDGAYAPYTGQTIKNNLVNSDGAHTSFELPDSMTLILGDSGYSGFGTGQMVKISGTGSRMTFPYNDCQITTTASSRVKISADIYLPSAPAANTMLFSIGGVGLYVPANSTSPVFVTSTGQSRAAAVNIIGKKVKIAATFSLGSLYDCELSIDGAQAIAQITTGLTEEQIAAAAVNDDMRGNGLSIGCWKNDNNYSTNFYFDNVVITRCGGTLKHTASCYTTYKQNDYYFQNLYNGLTAAGTTIDWTAKNDDGTYGNTSIYSKHEHSSSCLTIDSKGYQIALAEAKNGDWTSLKKELGTTLFNMVVSKFDIDTNNVVTVGTVYNFAYTGNYQTFKAPKAGKYIFETWGAQASGSYAGLGGYSKGTYSLTAGQTVNIYVGGQYGYNGGGTSMGNGGGNETTYGGGASDIRVGGMALSDRVIVAGGGGGGSYNGSWYPGIGGNYAYASYSLGQGEGYSHGCSNYVGAGGGGYYGGAASSDGASAGGQGGSGYIGGVTDASMSSGLRAGNGAVTITSIKTFPEDSELFDYIKANMNLIPDIVTTNRATIINPIWNCKEINNTGASFTEKTVLSCTEPHHFGSHYDFSSTICWDPCNDDKKHEHTKTEVFDANGTKVEQAAYVTLDNFFKVYFPNTGDFYGDGSYGLLQTSVNRGKGYSQNMDTTEWTREKYVKFDFDVLYERNGVWENHQAGDWISLELIDKSTTNTYTLSGGKNLSLNGNTYVFDTVNNLMNYNGGSTTLVEGGTMAVIDGKIFVLNGNGTVSVSSPCTEYNFYCLLENNEASCIEAQFAAEAINYDDQSSIDAPYAGSGDHEEEFDIYTYKNTYITNKDRFGDLTSHHTARKLGYLDIIGRIGNLIVEDTDDIRFSNYFKKSTVTNNDDWIIQGIVSKVDCSISEHYLSWHRNSAGYPLAADVRGEQVSEGTKYYNTWGSQEWTVKAKSDGMGLSADKNSNGILQTDQQKLGYNVLYDITTMGDYNRYLQVIPYFYALNKRTNELTPVDVYINDSGNTRPINYFGLYSEYMDSDGKYLDGYETLANKLYRYTMYLNWTDESARRNYTAGGRESSITDAVRDYFIEDINDSEGELMGYKYLTVPYGNYYNEGTMQCLQPGLRARTFLGTSLVTAIKEQSARLGITSNGINGGIDTNFDGAYLAQMFNHQAQRWHLKMGLPSSAVFSAYREKGIHVEPEEDWYVASYVENGITKTKQFSKAYLSSQAVNKEYAIGSTFLISGTQYTVTGKYKAGTEFNNNNDYVIIMTADIKAIGDVWNIKYSTGNDNGSIIIDGKTFSFGSNIPTFIAAYDTTSSLVDISTQNTH
ncbi:Glycine rich protein [Anaerocolumna jejuensis DSM 15929]|uniref:receptor protein-tyrosine kinase n=2 Tax=Anaerocolumna TaxID=1843210 RepID=A0A1M6ZU49_9FIRM|nr:Glycine rich protein [Anaerocolumna jejuensis DSM 15929]